MRMVSRSASLLSLSLAATLPLAGPGCSATNGEDSGTEDHVASVEASPLLDVNDVSVLFPFNRASETLSPDLPIDSFMSRAIFDQVIAASKTVNISHRDPLGSDVYENWRIVSFRFDPCAPSVMTASGNMPGDLQGKVPGCIVQLRLIAQPVAVRGPGAPALGGQATPVTSAQFPEGAKAPQDFAAHLVFNLGVFQGSADTETLRKNFAPFMPLVAGLQAIKGVSSKVGADTNGALMGVHPGLKLELSNNGSELSDSIAGYLKQVLKPERLSLVAFMGVPQSSLAPWIFLTGAVRPGADGTQTFIHNPLSGFDTPKMSQSLPVLVSARGEPLAFPDIPTRPLSIGKLFHPRNSKADILRGTFDIENPALTHALNMDCASCHGSHVAKVGVAGTGGIQQVSDIPPTRFIQDAGVTAYLSSEVTGSIWNVHNLGYLGIEPKVSERTLAESGVVVNLVNRLIAGDEHQNPGLDCGTDRAKLDQIYFCQLSTKSPSCFAECKIRGQLPVP